SDGTISITTPDAAVTGVGRIVDEADVGDSYNFGPLVGEQAITEPDSVAIQVLEGGPIRARIAVVREYRWPISADPQARRSPVLPAPPARALAPRRARLPPPGGPAAARPRARAGRPAPSRARGAPRPPPPPAPPPPRAQPLGRPSPRRASNRSTTARNPTRHC